MNVLVAIDFSDASDPTLEAVKKFFNGDHHHVHLLHAAEPDPDFVGYDAGPPAVRDQVAAEYHKEHQDLQAMAAGLKAAGVHATSLLVRGPFIETILEEATKLDAQMIVVGSHGHGATYDILVGSISNGVIRKSKLPVLVVPTTRRK